MQSIQDILSNPLSCDGECIGANTCACPLYGEFDMGKCSVGVGWGHTSIGAS